ncbi:MAG TPA: cytochrome c peroxidase [Noviherbaspirillum sp.]|uniref:cytochrome-c peroxidase n=1 Tax=Noviherbaspirillum sp. TaxID=1926288 RepID=UPI002D6C6319|nr:cytochrome c peroxidase [Noviherbaspirillum sp.]HYD97270.1 cytochrome c peroxidase [Noviherbaspirillum sp.]
MKPATRWVGLLGAALAATAAAATFGLASIDGWSADEITLLASIRLQELPPAPPDTSNAYEASPAAASLGRQIFFDRRFSGNGSVSCASCHEPDRQFQDGKPLGQGMGTGARRTMPVVGAGYSPFLFWDGRKDSLWAQALGPLEDPAEHGGSRLAYTHLLKSHYRAEYEAVFGALPELDRLPEDASPLGTREQRAAWRSMSEDARQQVSRVFANIGKALAAYQKTLRHGESRLDRYVDGLVDRDPRAFAQLSAQEKNGLRIFIGKGQCITCHNGPLLTDQHFHNTGVAPRHPGQPDPGRRAALARVRDDEFNCLGRFSDAQPEQCEELRFLATDDHAMASAFKTPGLRNVALRAPYMHAGQIATLTGVVRHYAAAPPAQAGHSELKPVRLSESEVRDLVAFLGTLSAVAGPVHPSN